MGESSTRPVVRSCRNIIDAAGDLAAMLATAPPGYLARIQLVAPDLCDALTSVTDAVLDLDHRTAYLAPPPPAAQTSLFAAL